MSMPGKMFFDTGKSRFEMNMSEMKSAKMPPQTAAQMKSMGMDRMIMIGRPDEKLGYQVFPGMQAYVENPLPEQESASAPSDFKIEVTELVDPEFNVVTKVPKSSLAMLTKNSQ